MVSLSSLQKLLETNAKENIGFVIQFEYKNKLLHEKAEKSLLRLSQFSADFS